MQVKLVDTVGLVRIFTNDAAGFCLEFLQFRFELAVGFVGNAEGERAHYGWHLGRCNEGLLGKLETLQLVLADKFVVIVRATRYGFLGRLPESVLVFADKP